MKLVLEMVSSVMRKCKDKQARQTQAPSNQRESIMIMEVLQAEQANCQDLADKDSNKIADSYIVNMPSDDLY